MMTILRPLSVMTPGPGDPEVAYAKQETSTTREPVYCLFLYGQVSTTIPLLTVVVVVGKKYILIHKSIIYLNAFINDRHYVFCSDEQNILSFNHYFILY